MSIDKYFKAKRSPKNIQEECGTKRTMEISISNAESSLMKIKKTDDDSGVSVKNIEKMNDEIICLSSDEENNVLDFLNVTPDISVGSNSIHLTPGTNTSSSSSTPESPVVTLFTNVTPKSKKYFSPTKNKMVNRKSPVKKIFKLSFDSNMLSPPLTDDDELFNVCKDMDDKTIFLLKMINKFLNEDSLKQLLDEDCQELLAKHVNILKPGMRIVCRLYWHLERWYLRDKIWKIAFQTKTPQINEDKISDVINSLTENGYLDTGSNMSFDELTQLLKLSELKDICKEFNLKKPKTDFNNKENLVQALKKFCVTKTMTNYFSKNPISNSTRVLRKMNEKLGPCYKLSEKCRNSLYCIYNLMYLGIDSSILRDKKLEFMLLCDINGQETYPIDKSMKVDSPNVVFKCKGDFYSYIEANKIYENFINEKDSEVKCNIIKEVLDQFKSTTEESSVSFITTPLWLHRYTRSYIYVKVLESGLVDLKRCDQIELALDVVDTLLGQQEFRQHNRAEWYSEKALLLYKHQQRYDDAAQVLLEGLKSNMPEERKDAMRARALKIANQKSIQMEEHLRQEVLERAAKEEILEKNFSARYIDKQHVLSSPGERGKRKYISYQGSDKVVHDAEKYCLEEYIASGAFTDGGHYEGKLVTTMFMLLFWDIIYSKPKDVAGVFLSHYQKYPLDYESDGHCFYENRREAIEARLQLIRDSRIDAVMDIMKNTWDSRSDSEVPCVREVPWARLSEAARATGPCALAALCARLARNPRAARYGFPDLTLWNARTNKIKFVEVKTDTDKPSLKQRQWMKYLKDNNIDAEFCYIGVNKTCSKSRASYNDFHKDL